MQVIAATTCKKSFLANAQVAQPENDIYKLRAMNLSDR
jgi:hypothetical protein